jgi:hypothetical protein
VVVFARSSGDDARRSNAVHDDVARDDQDRVVNEDRDDGTPERTVWDAAFLSVEFPTFTGFDPPRARRAFGLLVGGVLVVIVAVVALFWTSDPAAPQPTLPPLTFETVPPNS